MTEVVLNLLGMAFLWFAIECCLRHQTTKSLDDASLIPFADDPEVARRVEAATGKTINAVAPEEVKPGWGNTDFGCNTDHCGSGGAAIPHGLFIVYTIGTRQTRSRGIKTCSCCARKSASNAKVSGSFKPLVLRHCQALDGGRHTSETLP